MKRVILIGDHHQVCSLFLHCEFVYVQNEMNCVSFLSRVGELDKLACSPVYGSS